MRSRTSSPRRFRHQRCSSASRSEHAYLDLCASYPQRPQSSWSPNHHGGMAAGGTLSSLVQHKYAPTSPGQTPPGYDVYPAAIVLKPNTYPEIDQVNTIAKVTDEASLALQEPLESSLDGAVDEDTSLSPAGKTSEYNNLSASQFLTNDEKSHREVYGNGKNDERTSSSLEDAFRVHRRHRAALSYHILQCREQLSFIRRERGVLTNTIAILLQQLENERANPQVRSESRVAELSQILAEAVGRVNLAEVSLDSIEHDLNMTDGDLKLSEDHLKEFIVPDDPSECFDILDRVIEDMSLPAEHTSIYSEHSETSIAMVEVQLAPLQQSFLQEALYSSISNPSGFVDLDALLAQSLPSSLASSRCARSDVAGDEQDSHQLRRILEMELEVRLSGIQFQTMPSILPDALHVEDDIWASPAQIEKREEDLRQRESTTFYEDFWHIYRTSWLEFSRFICYLDSQVNIDFGSLLNLNSLLEKTEEQDRATNPAKAVEHAFRIAFSQQKLPMTASKQAQSIRSSAVEHASSVGPHLDIHAHNDQLESSERDTKPVSFVTELPIHTKETFRSLGPIVVHASDGDTGIDQSSAWHEDPTAMEDRHAAASWQHPVSTFECNDEHSYREAWSTASLSGQSLTRVMSDQFRDAIHFEYSNEYS